MLGLGLSLIKGAGKNVGAFLAYIKDSLKLYYRFYDTQPDFLLNGSTSFDGTDDYIDLDAHIGDFSSQTTGTISLWFKTSSDSASMSFISASDWGDASSNFSILCNVKKIQVNIRENGIYTIDAVGSVDYNDNKWHHLAFAVDGSGNKMYIDGSQISLTYSTGSASTQSWFNSVNDLDTLSIGANKDNTTRVENYFNGSMANVGIWDRALSASEVESIYWRGSYSELQNTELTNLVSWYDLSSETLGNNLITNGDFPSGLSDGEHGYDNGDGTVDGWTGIVNDVLSLDSSTKDGSANSLKIVNSSGWLTTSYNLGTLTDGKVYRVSYDISVVSGGANRRVGISNNTNSGSSEYLSGASATPTDGGGWESGSFTFQKSTTETSYFKVMGFTATIYLDNIVVQELSLEDSQGSNNGAPIGVTTNSDSYSGESPFKPRIQDKAHPKMAVQLADGSTSFDGTDDYIDTGVAFSNTNHTISGWFKLDNVSGNRTLFCGRDGNDDGIRVLLNTSQIAYQINTDDELSGTSSISANVWTHVACTYDGTTQSIYLNGSLSASQSISRTVSTTQTAKIGRTAYGTSDYMLGSLANIALYSSALTQSQVQELMFTEKYSGLSADLKTNLVSWYDLGSTTLGSELVTNGDFSDGSTGWTLGSFSIVNGQATITDASATDYSLDSDTITGFDTSKRYQLSYDCIANTAGIQSGAYIRNADLSPTGIFLKHTDTGTKTLIFTPTATSHRIRLYHDGGGAGDTTTFDNVSVKEITLDDSEGTNHGSPVGTTTNTGYTYSPHGVVDPLNFGDVYSGRALDFDGTNDYIDLSTPTFMNGKSAFTISSWVNLDTAGNFNVFTTNTELVLGFSSGKPIVSYRETDNTRNRKIATNALSTGQWYHVAGTWDKGGDGEIRIYVNGSYVAQSYNDGGASTASVLKDATDADIGRFTSGSEYFNGKIQSVKVLDSSLTQTQVQELYTKPETVLPTGVSASNLKLDLPMQEGAGSYVYDGSGNQNHGTISGATWVSGQEYGYQASLVRSNTPMVFDGSDDYVDTGQSFQNTFRNSFSISLWFQAFDGQPSSTNIICGTENSLDEDTFYIGFISTGRTVVKYQSNNTEVASLSDSAVLTDGLNGWNHIVATLTSGGNIVTYINGSAIKTTDVSSATFADWTSSDELFIGAHDVNGTANNHFNGLINDFAIWDVALDADAVTQLYGSGTPLLPTSDSGNYDNSDSLVGYWRNDSNSTWTDRANTGVASFDSTDDDITVTDSSSIQNIFDSGGTLSAWVYINSAGENGTGRIMDKRVANAKGWIFYTDFSIGNNVRFFQEFSSVSGRWDMAITTGQWNHLVVTYDNSNVSNNPVMYLNGVSQTVSEVVTPVGTRHTDVGQDLYIGNRSDGTSTFDGKMANVNVFNTALTATEVSELYAIDKRSSISGHSQFSNCVGSWLMGAGDGDSTSTIQDQTSNNNDGTVNGASLVGYNDGTASGSPVEIVIPEGSTEGRDNQGYYLSDTTTISNGARFFGDKEYIKVQDSEILQDIFDGGGSIEAWFYAESDGGSNGGRIINKRASGNGYLLYTISESGSNVTIQFAHEFSTTDGKWTITVPMKQWHHIVLTYDNGSVANNPVIYLNGISQTVTEAQTPVGTSLTDVGQDLYIGNDVNGVVNFDGKIDEVRIYKKVLSADEVSKNYNNGKSSHQ